jgi:hypothetical protein
LYRGLVILLKKKSFDNEFHLANTDSWFEVYKLTKEQWKSEIMAQEQVIRFRV